MNQALAAKEAELAAAEVAARLEAERVDITAVPSRTRVGARHPLALLQDHVEDIFVGMGWEIAEGPELEHEWFNFDALNFDVDHPARQEQDTFYVDPTSRHLVMRTHTSPVQVRSMLDREVPIYVLCPGRVYRTDEFDATHLPVFTQFEGLVVDKGITMAHLKGTLDHFAKQLFGPEAKTRFRTNYFPSPSPPPSSTCGTRPSRVARAGSSGAAAAWSTRTCCARPGSTRRCTAASRSAWASSGA